MKNLSSYEQIDILKFVNFDQLFSVQQTNYYFNLLIEQNKWILALKELYRISLRESKAYSLGMIDPISNIVNYPLNDQLLKKWQSALVRQIPLCLFKYDSRCSKYCYFYLQDLNREIVFELKLPLYPKNIEEMQIIYFCLEQLSFCSFESAEFFNAIINQEMINLLFENNKNIKFYLKIRNFATNFHNSIYKNQFEFILNNLVITNFIKLNFRDLYVEEQYNFLLKLLLNSGKNISCVFVNDFTDISKLYNSIIKHIKTSKDCSEIVSNIKFCGIDMFKLKMKIKADKIKMDDNQQKIGLCEFKNDYNPKIKFLAEFYYLTPEDEMIFKFDIKRIK